MDILDPRRPQAEKRASSDEAALRSAAAREEEARIMRGLNAAKDVRDRQNAIMDEDLERRRAEHARAVSEMAREVSALEARKAEAERPFKEILIEATERAEELWGLAREARERADQDILNAKNDKDEAERIASAALSRERATMETEQAQNERESALKAWERGLEAAWRELGAEKASHAARASEADAELSRREADVRVADKANADAVAQIAADRAEVSRDRRAIKDGYDTLADARRRILGRDA